MDSLKSGCAYRPKASSVLFLASPASVMVFPPLLTVVDEADPMDDDEDLFPKTGEDGAEDVVWLCLFPDPLGGAAGRGEVVLVQV